MNTSPPAQIVATTHPEVVRAPLAISPPRLVSLDAYRGFIMLVLASLGFGSVQMARQFPDSIWADIGRQFTHTPWIGCHFWDLIMPAFLFMVGVAMPFSFAARRTRGDSFRLQLGHAIRRALVLIVIGWLLQNQHSLFLNVLTQIGLGYVFVFLLLDRSVRSQLLAIAALLLGTWALYALYPAPGGTGYDFAARGATPADLLPGFWVHWSPKVNVAADFDRWLLNLFPQDAPFVNHVGHTQTLNFIPAMANILLGVVCGRRLMGPGTPAAKLRWLIVAGAICLAAALAIGLTVCPIVKRIWTPSFALFSGAWTFWMLAVFYGLVEVQGWRRWTFPLVVVGMNSIAIYVMTMLWPAWITKTLRVHFGSDLFTGTYGPIGLRCTVVLILWACCYWLYRRKIFLRV